MPEPLFEFRLTLLRDEIARVQTRIGHFDDLLFRIKGWAITLWLATFGFSISQGSGLFLLATIPVTFAFWTIETRYKSYQNHFLTRMRYIEKHLNPSGATPLRDLKQAFESQDFDNFPVYDPTGWQTGEKDEQFHELRMKSTSFLRCFWTRRVRDLYLALILLTIVAFVLFELVTCTKGM